MFHIEHLKNFDDLKIRYNVSHETSLRLQKYLALLQEWQRTMNLVAPSTIHSSLQRHVINSLELLPYLKDKKQKIVDFGSGAGFPGMVLSMMGYDVDLVESDSRKCAFLSEINYHCGASARILNTRIEKITGRYDVITARACAPLSQLYSWAYERLEKDARCLFLKGENYSNELMEAQKKWFANVTVHPTDGQGVILEVIDLQKQ